MFKNIIFIMFFSIILTTTAFAQRKPIITILDFNTNGIASNDMKAVVSLLSSAIFETSKFEVIDKSQRDIILAELKFSISGCADETCQLEIGKMLAAEYIVVGDISKVGSRFILNAKIIETKSSKTINTARGLFDSIEELLSNVDNLAIELSNIKNKNEQMAEITIEEKNNSTDIVTAEIHGRAVQENTPRGFNFSTGTGVSYLNGKYREIVYPDVYWANDYLSELIWDLDNILLLNLNGKVQWNLWEFNLSLESAVFPGTGNMTDTDWLDQFSEDRTHWSLSKVLIDKSFFIDSSINYNLELTNKITIPLGLGYKLNYWDWEDEVLDFIYPPPEPSDFTGVNGIDYMVIQNIFYVSTGMLFTGNNITAGLNFFISPYIKAWDLDHHILRELYFLDTFEANLWYKTELTVIINTGHKNNIILNFFFEELPETIGNTDVFEESEADSEELGDYSGTYIDGAGHASITWGIGLSYIWKF
jgi:outer membrane protease